MDRLRDIAQHPDYHGPRFIVSMPAMGDFQSRPASEIILDLYRILQKPALEFPNLMAADSANHHFSSWLNRLSDTATFQREGETQRQFVSIIVRAIEEAERNPSFCEVFINALEHASESCGDRVALSVLNIGIQHTLASFPLENPSQLANFLIRSLMAMGLLEEYARQIIPTLKFVDPIEVYLGLPIMLQESLQLPINIHEPFARF